MQPALLAQLNVSAEALVDAGGAHFLQITLLAVVLALIDFVCGRRIGPHWRCALWLIFFIKLVLPPELGLPSSPAYWWPRVATFAVPTVTPLPGEPATMAPTTGDPWAPAPVGDRFAPPPTSLTPSSARLPSWQTALVASWLVGFLSLAAATVVRHRGLAQALRSSELAPVRLQAALAAAQTRVGLRTSVRLRLTGAGIGPLVAGLWRPTIYLPATLAHTLTAPQLHAVLVHELSHVQRGDLWVAAAQTFARVVFFYHPAVWWVNAHLDRLREEATDRAVLAHPEVDARAYSLALVEAAAGVAQVGPVSRFALGVVETKSQLATRITMNLSHPRSGRARLSRSGLLSLVLLGLVLVPMAPAESREPLPLAPAGFKPVDPAALVQRIDSTSTSIFAAFNRRDREAYLAAFAPDGLMLPPGSPLLSGRAGVGQSYLQSPAALTYERMNWTDRQIFQLDRWVIETGVVGFDFRLGPGAPIMTDPRAAFTIWTVDDNDTLRVKVLAWNRLVQPDALERRAPPQVFVNQQRGTPFGANGDFSAVLAAEETLHRAFEEKHVDQAGEFYADGAALFTPETLPLRGKPAILSYLRSIPRDRAVRTIERQVAHVEGNENHVLVVNLFRWTFVPAGSDVVVPIAGKGIHLWQRGADGAWRILFDLTNTSQPTG